MTQLMLQPRGSARVGGARHYQHSVRAGVPLRDISPAAGVDFQTLRTLFPGGVARLWGSTPTSQQNNWKARALRDRQVGDHVLFYADSGFFARGRIVHLFRNRPLARHVWGTDDDQDTWEHMMALDGVEEFARPVVAEPILRFLEIPVPLRSLTLVDALAYAQVAVRLPGHSGFMM